MTEAPGKSGGVAGEAPADSGRLPRLPAGRHGLSREFVVQNQRERIITALADTVAERGYSATAIAQITKAAGVSRATFYEHFPDKEACFLAAYEMATDHIVSSMRAAASSFGEWPQKVRAALASLLGFLAAEPELARLVLIESIAAGGEVADRHNETMESLAEILRTGRPAAGDERLPEATDEALVGGIVSLIVREIEAGHTEQLKRLLPDLVELTLAPYLGPDEAARLAGQ